LKKYSRSENIIIFDFDGTLVDVWERYYKIFNEFWKLDLDIQLFRALKWQNSDEYQILRNLNVFFTDKEFENYKNFKRQKLEEKKFLALDKLIINTKTLKRLKNDYLILTMRKNKDNFNWQIQKLNLSQFFYRKCVVLEPKGKDTKKNWLFENAKRISDRKIMVIGDSESDLEMGGVSRQTNIEIDVYLVKSGLRNPDKIIKESYLSANIIKDVNEFLLKILHTD
jgi:phosphoglycolate phosphatase-like HAD superfamily hydrolase